MRKGGFFTWSCHHGIQLIIIMSEFLSLSHSALLLLSLTSIMAVSSSSVHLLLLISSLDLLSTRGSAFLSDWDHMTSSGRFLVSLQLYVRTENQGEKNRIDVRQISFLDSL